MKKAISKLLAAIILLAVFIPGVSFAAPEYDAEKITIPVTYMIEAKSGKVLFDKEGTKEIEPASTTKLMTALLFFESNPELDEKITVGKEVSFTSGSSLLGLKSGDEVSLRDLVYGMMLISGNDCAAAIAVHIAGSVDEFATRMNDKAKELGMEKTYFANPHGLHVDEKKGPTTTTTAEDFAKLAVKCYENQAIMKVASARQYTPEWKKKGADEPEKIYNTNKLLTDNPKDNWMEHNYEYANGLKTGQTPYAKNCLVASAQKDGMDLILLQFGDESKNGDNRWSEAAALFDFGFESYRYIDLKPILEKLTVNQQVQEYHADDAEQGMLELIPDIKEDKLEIFDDRGSLDAIEADPEIIDVVADLYPTLTAPVLKGQHIGTVTYRYDGKDLYKFDLVASRNVADAAAESADVLDSPSPGATAKTTAAPESEGFNLLWLLAIPGVAILGFLVFRIVTFRKADKLASPMRDTGRLGNKERDMRIFKHAAPKEGRVHTASRDTRSIVNNPNRKTLTHYNRKKKK